MTGDGRFITKETQGSPDEAPWRNSFGGEKSLAPAAKELRTPDEKVTKNPNEDGPTDAPWRKKNYGEQLPPSAIPKEPGTLVIGDPNRNGGTPIQELSPWADQVKLQVEKDRAKGSAPMVLPSGDSYVDLNEKERQVAKSLERSTDLRSLMFVGATTGWAMNSAMYGLDSLMINSTRDGLVKSRLGSVNEAGTLMNRWRNYSPLERSLREFDEKIALYGQQASAADVGSRLAAAELDKASAAFINFRKGLSDELGAATPQGLSERAILQRQLAFLKDTANLDPDAIKAATGTADEVASGLKTFTARQAEKLFDPFDANPVKAPSFTRVKDMMGALTTQVDSAAPAMAGDGSQALLRAKVGFLDDLVAVADPAKVRSVIGSADEVARVQSLIGRISPDVLASNNLDKIREALAIANGGEPVSLKFFTAAEAKPLIDHADAVVKDSVASAQRLTARSALEGAQDALLQARNRGLGDYRSVAFDGIKKGIFWGGVTVGAQIAADHLIGQPLFGYNPEARSVYSFGAESVGLYAAFNPAMPKTVRVAGGLIAAGSIGSDWLWSGRTNSITLDKYMRPNALEVAGVTAAAMLPIDWKVKLPLMGVGLVGGKAWNFIRSSADDPAELQKVARISFSADQIDRTEASYKRTLEKLKTLGVENEFALEHEAVKWSQQQNTPRLDWLRGDALTRQALGEVVINKGSRVNFWSLFENVAPSSVSDGKFDYILPKHKIDLGAYGTTLLEKANLDFAEAIQLARSSKGQVVAGKLVDDAYIEQLENLRKGVQKQLDIVYGQHDIQTIFQELSTSFKKGSDPELIRRTSNMIGDASKEFSQSERRFGAKINRDAALALVARADWEQGAANGESAKISMEAVYRLLIRANTLEPNHPDMKKLVSVADSIAAKVGYAQRQQWNSILNNPHRIPMR